MELKPNKEKKEFLFYNLKSIQSIRLENMTSLSIIRQSIDTLEGLEESRLKELWCCECQLTRIAFLPATLEKLFLYENIIEKIENIPKSVKVLYLNDNLIEILEITYPLDELNIANNKISCIDKNCARVKNLNMAGNSELALIDVLELNFIQIETLVLNDQNYKPTDMEKFGHYFILLAYHLPSLHMLDFNNVDRQKINSLFYHKQIFYGNRLNEIKNKFHVHGNIGKRMNDYMELCLIEYYTCGNIRFDYNAELDGWQVIKVDYCSGSREFKGEKSHIAIDGTCSLYDMIVHKKAKENLIFRKKPSALFYAAGKYNQGEFFVEYIVDRRLDSDGISLCTNSSNNETFDFTRFVSYQTSLALPLWLRSIKGKFSSSKFSTHPSDVCVVECDFIECDSLEWLSSVEGVKWASFRFNGLKAALPFAQCRLLEQLVIDYNKINCIDSLFNLPCLTTLDANSNNIRSINFQACQTLTRLSLDCNSISSIEGIQTLQNLQELYLGNNNIKSLDALYPLQPLNYLYILDLSHNPLTTLRDYRSFTLFYIRALKILDFVHVNDQEIATARKLFQGKLTHEFLSARLTTQKYKNLLNLKLWNAKLIDISECPHLPSLKHLSLDSNAISDISRISEIAPNLKSLRICDNRISTLRISGTLPHLAELVADNNSICKIGPLSYYPSLSFLSLKENRLCLLTKDCCRGTDLMELCLSKNQIRHIEENALNHQHKLTILNLNDNRLRSMIGLENIAFLERLEAKVNRIQEVPQFVFASNRRAAALNV